MEVGAGSVIRGAVIGDETVIADSVNINYSVIGDHCNIREGTVHAVHGHLSGLVLLLQVHEMCLLSGGTVS